MYKYVDMNTEIYLGYIIFCLIHINMIKQVFWIFTYEGNSYCSILVKHICFQYSFVTIH